MVELMKEHPSKQLVTFDHQLVTVEVETVKGHHFGTDDLEEQPRKRQAALLEAPLPSLLDDLGVDDRLGTFTDVVDEEAALYADLRGREPAATSTAPAVRATVSASVIDASVVRSMRGVTWRLS